MRALPVAPPRATAPRGQRSVALFALVWLAGCALQVEVPRPDPVARLPPVKAPMGSLSLAVELEPAQLAAAIDGATAEPLRYGQRSAIVGGWSLQVERRGAVGVTAEDGRLCVRMPFAGQGRIEVLGRALDHAVDGALVLCARPRVRPDAHLVLEDAEVRVEVDRRRVELATRVLVETLQAALGDGPAAAARRRCEALAIPLAPLVQSRLQALRAPIALEADVDAAASFGRDGRSARREVAGACLRVRPERLMVGQPVVSDGRRRSPARLEGRPSGSLPCGADGAAPAGAPPVAVAGDPDLRALPLALTLPLAMRLDDLAPRAAAALRDRGAIALAGGGAVTLRSPRIAAAAGRLTVRADIAGQVRDRWLGVVPVRRDVVGALAIWGTPVLEEGAVALREVRFDLGGGDRVQAIATALQRDPISAAMGRALRLPTAPLLQRAEAMLNQLDAGIAMGDGSRIPARVDRKALSLKGVRVESGWLIVEAAFVGHVVIGTPAPAAPARRQPR